MSKYQDALLYGKYENRLAALVALGVPDDTPDLTGTEVQDKPHFAIKAGSLWVWDPVGHSWSEYLPEPTTSGGAESFTATAAQTVFTTSGDLPTASYKVSAFRNGVLVDAVIAGNDVQISACDAGDEVRVRWYN